MTQCNIVVIHDQLWLTEEDDQIKDIILYYPRAKSFQDVKLFWKRLGLSHV